MVEKSYDLMKDYCLLPNDAIILATCIKHGVEVLVTLDRDFKKPCNSEGVRVVMKGSEL